MDLVESVKLKIKATNASSTSYFIKKKKRGKKRKVKYMAEGSYTTETEYLKSRSGFKTLCRRMKQCGAPTTVDCSETAQYKGRP